MGDLSTAKIYKIVCNELQECYVGSTTWDLETRFQGHKASYKRWKNGKCSYTTSYRIIEYESARIELIEAYSCETLLQLREREGYWITQLECVNKHIAGRTRHETVMAYVQNNKDKMAQYREDNREKVLEGKKLWYAANKERLESYVDCDCGHKYQVRHKSRHFRRFH